MQMQNSGLLRYRIGAWHQLSKAQSNNSNKLSITVSDFIQNDRLEGTRIQVIHEDFGPLFVCLLDGGGSIISEIADDIVPEFTTQQILTELKKFGFIIEYKPVTKLPSAQIDYLISLRQLHFDKIRVLYVHEYINNIKDVKWYVVAFNIESNPQWINNWYSPHKNEYQSALMNGSALNLLNVSASRKFRWTWLVDNVMSIEDILEANA